MRCASIALLLAARAAVAIGQEYEWVGVFDTSADTSHTWIAEKVDGDYADPTMLLVMIATDTPTADTMEDSEDTAATLMAGTCTVVNSGDTMTPTTSGVCYTLTFDSDSDTSTFTIDTTDVDGIVFAGQHLPTEFEATQHYFQDSSGGDVEPIAQEGGMRYAFFECSSDGSLISYGEECMSDTCGNCTIGENNVDSGSCYVAGGYVHTATCDTAGVNVTVKIYEDDTLTCASSLTGVDPTQTHYHLSGLCEVEEHDHEGDHGHEEDHSYIVVSCSGTSVEIQSYCDDDHCDSCDTTEFFADGFCNEEDHDGETEYIKYVCDNTAGTVTMTVYEGTGVTGCDDDTFIDSEETIVYTSGTCVEDEHGHDDHDADVISAATVTQTTTISRAILMLAGAGALLMAN